MPVTVLDAHVHFYPRYDAAAFLRAAEQNFLQHRRELGFPAGADEVTGVLCLTESAGHDWFATLSGTIADWQVEPVAGDTAAVLLKAPTGTRLLILAGYQVVSAENLELLLLGTRHRPANGAPMGTLIEQAAQQQIPAILPWGFGKWWLRRGALMDQLIEQHHQHIYLGDNAGRPQCFSEPRQFRRARALNVKVLPGSDPLPLSGQGATTARYGFTIEQAIGLDQPSRWLQENLQRMSPRPCGRREGLLRFASNQLAMQLLKRTAANPPPG